METLLQIDWEQKYYDYIKKMHFDDMILKDDFLDLLLSKDSKKREQKWEMIRVSIPNINELFKLPNPYYIGFGNPNSDILFLGKEKGFDIIENPELLIKESINNVVHWEHIKQLSHKIDQKKLLNHLGFNPLFPRIYHTQNLHPRHTWGLYSQIIGRISGHDQNKIFQETNKFENSFFNHCFISEINHVPSKYSQGYRLIPERKELLEQDFYKGFSKIIIGAKGYLEMKTIQQIFGLDNVVEEISLGFNKKREIKIHKIQEDKRTIIYCDHLSGGAGWTDEAIANLANEII